jgi:hypothetical protein
MRIGINALFWGPNQMGGTQTYLTKLVEALVRTFPRDEFVVFLNADGREAFPVRSENLSIIGAMVVVTPDIPPNTIAAGSSARPIKTYDPKTGRWEKA